MTKIYTLFISVFLFVYSVYGNKTYIVNLKSGSVVTTDMLDKSLDYFQIGDYSGLIINDEKLANEFSKLDIVENVEIDLEVNIDSPPEIDIIYNRFTSVPKNQYQWGLDRIDQKDLPLNKKYKPPTFGKGTYVYVCDTGVRISHNEFGGRVENGYSHYGSTPSDGHGHGTHVMSTVLGKTVGVAKDAKGVAVKVLTNSGSGTISGVIKGIEWSVNDVISKKRCGVISMSLGGGFSNSLNAAVNAAVNAGINIVVSAGNGNSDACKKSPASASKAITVGSTTSSDSRSYFSNIGECVDILAPGSSILGASNVNDKMFKILSGTSMACPHVSGALAILFNGNSCKYKTASQDIRNLGVTNTINNVPSNTPNIFLQIQNIRSPTKIPTHKPTKVPTLVPTKSCYKECKSQSNNDKCINHERCNCNWKDGRRKRKCRLTLTSKPTKEPTRQPTTISPSKAPTFNCVADCKMNNNNMCKCRYNKQLGGKCDCKWKKNNKCIVNLI